MLRNDFSPLALGQLQASDELAALGSEIPRPTKAFNQTWNSWVKHYIAIGVAEETFKTASSERQIHRELDK